MKTMIKKGIAVMVLMFVFAGYALAEIPAHVKVAGKKNVYLFLGEITSPVSISILDEDGYVLYSRSVKNRNTYSVQYDMHQLPDGVYVLKLNDGMQIKEVSVFVVNNRVSVYQKLERK